MVTFGLEWHSNTTDMRGCGKKTVQHNERRALQVLCWKWLVKFSWSSEVLTEARILSWTADVEWKICIDALNELWHQLWGWITFSAWSSEREENVFDDVTRLIVPLSWSVLCVLNWHYDDFTDTVIATLPLMELPDTSNGTSSIPSAPDDNPSNQCIACH